MTPAQRMERLQELRERLAPLVRSHPDSTVLELARIVCSLVNLEIERTSPGSGDLRAISERHRGLKPPCKECKGMGYVDKSFGASGPVPVNCPECHGSGTSG